MRRLLAVLVTALVVAGCSGQTATPTDPYQVVDKSLDASWNLVQVNVGVTGTSDGKTVTIDPSAIQLVLDTKGGRAAFHVSLPVADLGADTTSLAELGVTGQTIDVDVLYDGQALYAKGQVVTTLLTLLLAQTGQTAGDLSGWIQLATKADLAALAGQVAPSALPSFAAPSAHTPDSIKQALSDAGITLAYVSTETKNGKNAYHLTAAIDPSKFRSSHVFDSMTGTQLNELTGALQSVVLTGDVWIATDSNRVVEVDLHVAPAPGASPAPSGLQKADVQVVLSEPSDASALQAPTTFTPVSLSSMLGQILQLVGQGLQAP
jgi:hypothetical protein